MKKVLLALLTIIILNTAAPAQAEAATYPSRHSCRWASATIAKAQKVQNLLAPRNPSAVAKWRAARFLKSIGRPPQNLPRLNAAADHARFAATDLARGNIVYARLNARAARLVASKFKRYGCG